MRQVDFNDRLKFEILRNAIRESIERGDYAPGDQLPSVRDLSTEYGLSTNTVREAIGWLVQDGFVTRIQGKGTFVAEPKIKFKTIGLIMPHFHAGNNENPNVSYDVNFAAPIIYSIESEARRYGSGLLLYLNHADNETTENWWQTEIGNERANILDLIQRKVDGIVIRYSGSNENLKYLQMVLDKNIPLVMVDIKPHQIQANSVTTNNYQGAYDATKLLLDLNNKNIVFVCHTGNELSAVVDRRNGYTAAMAESGSIPPELWFIGSGMRVDDYVQAAYESTKKRLSDLSRPFALFAVNAPTLSGIWKAIKEFQIPVEDYVLATFDEPTDDLPEEVRLLKVIQPLEEMGRKSVQLLMENSPDIHSPRNILLNPMLTGFCTDVHS